MGIFAKNRASESVMPRLNVRPPALLGLIAAVVFLPIQSAGQPAKPWTPKHTPDGQPDLQGFWSNSSITPMERPAALAGKEFYTEQEQAENEKRAQIPQSVTVLGGTLAHYDFVQFGLDLTQAKRAVTRRTSLVVDPPDGKIPPLTPEARTRVAERAAARKRSGAYDGPENRGLQERCILTGAEGPPMLPEAYNSNLQIIQAPGYVAILQEEIHDVRIIPLSGRPHIGPRIRQLRGDSRGRWEGQTLIVDTTNFTDRSNFRGSSEALHLVERFTRLDEDTILYQFTVEDPATWVRPWTAEIPMTKIEGPLYEFACHEGNYGLANSLSAARAQEKAAEEAAKRNAK
jgi:hypothetical protein